MVYSISKLKIQKNLEIKLNWNNVNYNIPGPGCLSNRGQQSMISELFNAYLSEYFIEVHCQYFSNYDKVL